MKKILIFTVLAFTSIFSTASFAKGTIEAPYACYYKDHFHLDDLYVKKLVITKLTHDENVVAEQKDMNSFYIRDTRYCPPGGGYTVVRYQGSKVDFCDLTVHDAEDMYDPEITAVCYGGNLHYAGLKYDGTGSYSYTILFN